MYIPINRKYFSKLLIFTLVFALFCLPIAYLSFTPQGQARMKGSSVFQDTKPHDENVACQVADWLQRDRWSVNFFHQTAFEYTRKMLLSYFSHFGLDFLYLGTNNYKINLVPQVGLEYLWELPFLITGLFFSS